MKSESSRGRRAEPSLARTKKVAPSPSFGAAGVRTVGHPAVLPKVLLQGDEPRHTQRVLLRMRASIHLALQGKFTTLAAITLSVYDRGALVILQKSLPVDARLVLENAFTREKIACKVARPARETPEGYHTTIEFDSPAPHFWKINFPPLNWRAEDV